ncbi:MAG: HAD hydrolase-like protein, partial [Alphaproteobacteria bacterium]|nr:HAD hydrolase-like protein [Alphaproteobacteria bacterium]
MAGIIFDLDGTLVDTASDLLAATNAVLKSHGRGAIGLSTVKHMVGLGARSLLLQAFAATGAPADEAAVPGLVNQFRAYYREHIVDCSKPYPNVVETLRLLRSRGTVMGVLTNKIQDHANLVLSRLGLEQFCRTVLGAGVRPCSKPDPRLLLEVAAELG